MTTRTARLARATLVTGGLALLVAACGSGGGSSTDSAAAASSAVVSTASVGDTTTLTDRFGKTLYSADVEANGQIKCVDTCTTFWEPLMASKQQAEQATSRLGETFGVVSRPDGSSQLTLKGLPLYTFAEEGAGELNGNGFTDDFAGTHFIWKAAGTNGAATGGSTGSYGGGGRYGY